ncbi:HYR domain-containing protein [Paracrocinitomix mangrovi]|uniref:HYR domain-containing protein n=1 Tax=Paracrocinitomix mangrovi TaxID=2862509 RepID=UPI001EDC2F85|nr:HYR domain-containing protein [Paracrocinitomix mangrovi]UKN00093.1 HYR domain-containing protein [Paracrocinitomix mangrovi]
MCTYTAPVGADNCPGSVTAMTAGQASGTIFPIGTTTVTYQVTDASGNTAQCSFDVTVNDNEAPTISCPADITLSNDGGACGAIVFYSQPTFNDNCPGSTLTLTAGQASGTLFPIGTTTVTYQVTDASGNTASCSFNVTINDVENPSITCPTNITVNNDPGLCGAVVSYTTPVGTDNCPGVVTSMIAGQPTGTVFPIGTTTVTYQAVDASGNTSQCSFNVTVIDNENPTITCPADITVNNDPGICGATVTYTAPVGLDNCPGSTTTMIAGLASGSLFPIGTTIVTYQVTDASGNTSQCSFNIAVLDSENPTITCPADITVNNITNVCGATVTYTSPVGIDNCPGATTVMTTGSISGALFPVGVTTQTFVVTDASGNTAQCTFDVTVLDVQNPVINCPADIIVNNDPGSCGAIVTYTIPNGTDNCPGATTIITAGQASGTLFPIGTTTVTYQVTDASGNSTTCSFDVTVNDNENPAITCPANITVNNDPGVCGALVTYTTPTGTDNCPGSTTTMIAGQASGTVFPIGTTTVTYEVVDATGNSTTCSFDVTVIDSEFPTVSCPANITVNNDLGVCGAVVTYIAPVGADNCPGSTTTMIAGQGSGSVFPIGTTTVTFEVIDASGNTTTCSFDVIVIDNENPTISCPADIIVNNDPGVCGAIVNYTTPIGSDNCPASVTIMTTGLASGSVFPIGTTTVTYEVTDASGNIASCSFDVTVNDNEAPTITCPADITVNNDPGVCGAIVTYTLPNGLDNCPGATTILTAGQASGTLFPVGTTTVSYQVTDASGNTASCSFDIIVIDNEVPTITCPPDQNDFYDANCEHTLLDYTSLVSSSDNCGVASVVQSPAPGTILTADQLITMTATDVNGNTFDCTFNLFLADSTSPSIICPPDQNDFFDASCQFTVPDYTPLVVTADNCGIVTVTQNPVPGSTISGATNTITFTADDGNGNTSVCSINLFLADSTSPTITCPADQNVAFDANCQYTLLNYTGMGSNGDNCGPITITQSPIAGTVITDTTTITLTATDAAGNSSSCTFNVNPSDQTIPTIACPPNQNVYLDNNCQFTLPDYTGLAVAADNCGPISVSQNPPAGTVIVVNTTVTFSVVDGAGNINNCSFTVIPIDTIAPTITCPVDQVVSLSPTCDYTMTDFTGLAVTDDNCAVANTIQSVTVGTIITTTTAQTFTVSDNSGNTASCTFNIIPVDDTPPSLTCPSNQNVNFNNSCQHFMLDYTFMVANADNCGPITLLQSPLPSTVISDTVTVYMTAIDGAGNVATCNFQVNPSDNTPPAIVSCLSDQNEYVGLSCKYTIPDYTGMITAIDNCGSYTVSQSPIPGTDVSTNTTITMTVTDGNGNSSTCNFDVLLTDTISPTIACPPTSIDVYFDVNCQYQIVPFDSLVTPFDNCGTTFISQLPAVGTIIDTNQTMTMIVTDATGNTGQCQFNLIPQDTIAPVIGCPGTQIAYLDTNCEAFLGDYTGLANTTANCEAVLVTQDPPPGTQINGTTTVLLYGADASGNISFCSFNVVLDDTIPPTVTCPADIYTCFNLVTFTPPPGNDNCGPVTVTRITGLPTGSTFPDGNTVMTYVAEDAYGNTDTCSFNIFVFTTPVGSPAVTQISCYGETDGSVDLTVNLGNPPFTYEWSNSATSEDIFGLSEGTYSCIITDVEGCKDTVEIDIIEPDSLYVDETVTPISCYGEIDGKVFVVVNGGTFPYSYNWLTSGAGNSANGLGAGDYTLIVTDSRGCQVTETYTITEPDSISIDSEVSFYPESGYQISVENGSDGWIDITPSGGNPPYLYNWDNGGITEDLENLIAGTYTVIVTDTNGCEQTATFVLDQPLAPVFFTGLTPNGDGYNDLFIIENLFRYPDNTLTIMNRWGDVVYQAAPYNNDWDGTPNRGIVIYGDKVPEGSYYYVFEPVAGSKTKMTGYIVIKR